MADETERILKVIAEGALDIGSLKMKVYVLDNGERVISEEDAVKFFEWAASGTDEDRREVERGMEELARFIRGLE